MVYRTPATSKDRVPVNCVPGVPVPLSTRELTCGRLVPPRMRRASPATVEESASPKALVLTTEPVSVSVVMVEVPKAWRSSAV